MEKKIEYGMVDLGLPSGLKWADRNVGAAMPEAIGDYFMFGSTTPDTDNVCDWAHAPFNNGQEDYDEAYFNENKSEWLTENGTLKPEYDAAYVNMGVSWRMPTSYEIRELLNNTIIHRYEKNGVEVMAFASKIDSANRIYIPFGGERNGSSISGVGMCGVMPSSSICADEQQYFETLYFNIKGTGRIGRGRLSAFPIRGVCI